MPDSLEKEKSTSGFRDRVKDGVVISAWVFSLIKYLTPAILAIIVMYVRQENFVTEIVELKNKCITFECSINSFDKRIAIQELKQSIIESDLTKSISRIENDIKEIKRDVKTHLENSKTEIKKRNDTYAGTGDKYTVP
jgi:hypothetical protein